MKKKKESASAREHSSSASGVTGLLGNHLFRDKHIDLEMVT